MAFCRRGGDPAAAAAASHWRAADHAPDPRYIELFQGTPLLMQLFLAFFGVALFGIDVSPWTAASLALVLHQRVFA
ncbi:ABC transporter permease subunit [Enterobacter cloacae subsp. cloacae]|nr:ABC transporter permease subunit [Enterobacter cloacae subsp. cloacae]